VRPRSRDSRSGTAGRRTRYSRRAAGAIDGGQQPPMREREMRKITLVAALAAAALPLPYAAAQDVQHAPGEEQEGTDSQQTQRKATDEMKVTGMVAEADQETKEITIGDKTFVMPEEGGGASLFPQVGAEVTVFYEEQGGKNVITRIGQAQ
jgi:hypothetical protein